MKNTKGRKRHQSNSNSIVLFEDHSSVRAFPTLIYKRFNCTADPDYIFALYAALFEHNLHTRYTNTHRRLRNLLSSFQMHTCRSFYWFISQCSFFGNKSLSWLSSLTINIKLTIKENIPISCSSIHCIQIQILCDIL